MVNSGFEQTEGWCKEAKAEGDESLRGRTNQKSGLGFGLGMS